MILFRLPFGRAVEQYLYSLPISHNMCYKVQNRKRVNAAVKQGLIKVDRVEGSVDYLGWRTENGQCKSTNRLDDILLLTEDGKRRVQQIRNGEGNDLQVCAVYEVMLTEVDSDHPVRMIIKGNHVPQNIIQQTTALSQINLSREAQDLVIKSRRANKRTPKEIKSKLLALHNGASQHELQNLYIHELVTCVLKQKGVVLHYQQPDTNAPEDRLERYYQLTLSDNLWLQQACNFGFFLFWHDGKYDLNSDGAPILSLVVEDSAGYGTLIAFGISNKENSHTIRIAELSNGRGFARIRNCAPLWRLFAMIDKHRPSKWVTTYFTWLNFMLVSYYADI
ncbi:19442_t:CDS:2, partial [Gigaspora rosea]